jgi:hypothetical protein
MAIIGGKGWYWAERGKYTQLIDVWVEDAVYKTDGRRFVGVLVWDFDVDFPVAAFEGSYLTFRQCPVLQSICQNQRTFFGPLETNVELLPIVIVSGNRGDIDMCIRTLEVQVSA